MTKDDALCDWTATDLLAGYATGQLSPVEATEAVLDRIERLNPLVNAFCLVDADGARDQARASADRWRRGEPQGLLDGVPVSVKDLFLTRGLPTRKGSLSLATDAGPWDVDAPCVARLREHGAVLIGKTTTSEFGWKGVTDSPLTGITRNPADPSCTAGGSSGGSAVAVALGMAPLSVGTDGGGSVRIPAAFCGIFGFKPTHGRIALFPASPFGALSHAGPMSRAVADAALLTDVLAGPDPRDHSLLPPPTQSFTQALEGQLQGLRVAYAPRLARAPVHPDVASRVRHAVDALAGLGAHVEQADPGFADPADIYHTLWFAGAAKVVQHLTPQQREQLDPGLAAISRVGATTTALDYLEAMAGRAALCERTAAFHERYDLLITPTVPIPAFRAGQDTPDGLPDRHWTSWTPFTYPFNLTGQPAASVPCGTTADGLPVGVQLIGARHADDLVLRASHWLQKTLALTTDGASAEALSTARQSAFQPRTSPEGNGVEAPDSPRCRLSYPSNTFR